MNSTSRFLPALLIAVFALSVGAIAQTRPPITVQQCFVTVPKHMSTKASGTQITYTNTGHQMASKVTFAVSYKNSGGNYLRRVSDVGSFAPGATIDHHFDLYNDVTFGGKTAHCSVVSVTFANGHVWHM
ncbi:MAG TPA: hypothetical protein VMB20_04690 [Candidatus Acidoferrum sp.]|nr:hypothetical protein [Candidatus Acidoferrum sp.]